MSFSDRMRRVQRPEELHQLMMEVRRKGSGSWTLSTVQDRVPRHLWPFLEDHFRRDGTILGREEQRAPEPRYRTAFSILAAVQQLNSELRSARHRGAQAHRERLEASRATPSSARSTQAARMAGESALEPKPAAVQSRPTPEEELRSGSVGSQEELDPPPKQERTADHIFAEGWCTRCGISAEAAAEQGWACDPLEK